MSSVGVHRVHSEKKILVGYLLIRSSQSNLLTFSVRVIKDAKFENVFRRSVGMKKHVEHD